MSDAYRVCFVCPRNICRSPMAEWVLRKRIVDAYLADDVEVASAGLDGWHVGERADHRTVYALRTNGYECEHVARRFEASEFGRVDLVVAMDAETATDLNALASSAAERAKVRLLREFDPDASDDVDVPDPYEGTSADFTACLRLIEAATPGLLDHVAGCVGVAPAMS